MRSKLFTNSSSMIALATVASSLTLFAAGPAQAQEATAQPAPAEQSGLNDIVVTAERRPSVAQKTAIALTVIDSEALAKNGVGSLTEIGSIAPGVNFSQQVHQTIVVIRGVSSRDANETGDPAVSVSIDGFNLQRSTGLNMAMFDLERVEVLRGPQGTLLGRNATGGAINVITAKPSDLFAASMSGEVGNFGTFNTNGFVNLPVTDWLNVRASFQTRDRDGFRNNAPAKDADDEHSRAARLHLGFEPSDRLTGLLTFEYAQNKTNGVAYYASPVDRYTASNVPPGLLVGDIILRKPDIPNKAKDFPLPPGQFLDTKVWSIRGTANYDLGFANLTYVGGWRRLTVDRLTSHGGAYGSSRQNFAFRQNEAPISWNHELRLAGDAAAPLFWQVGAFYFREKNSIFSSLGDFPNSPGLYGAFVPLQTFSYPEIRAEAKAVFGQATYEVLPGLKVEAGARYTKDDKDRYGGNSLTSPVAYLTSRCGTPGNAACIYSTANQEAHASSKKATYHAAVNYQVAPQNLLYAKFDTGYKAGGFTDLAPYGPETIKAFEIGSKNRFLNNSVQFNVAAFYYDYSDQQVSQTLQRADGVAQVIVVNAGKTRYRGIEADLMAQVSDRDRFDAFVGYTDAKYRNFNLAVSGLYARIAAAEGRLDSLNNWQLAGRRPPQAPEWVVNMGYEHDWDMFGGTLTTRLQTHFESQTFFSVYNNDSDRQNAYTKSDFIVTYKPANEKWDIQAYVRNIENSLILTNSADASSTAFLTYRYQFAPPRTYGARLTVHW